MNSIVRRYEAGPEAAAAALGCRWSGGEGSGPCPACGGTDRFAVRLHRSGDGRLLASCRRCEDGNALREALALALGPEPPDPARLREGAFAVGRSVGAFLPTTTRSRRGSRPGGRAGGSGDPSPTTAPPRRPGGSTKRSGAPDTRPAALAKVARAPDGTPAALHLVNRRCWPPPGRHFPPSVRWIPANRWPRMAKVPRLPSGAAGALGFLYFRPGSLDGELSAVSVEALRADGSRTAPRWRRTFGRKAGARFVARDAAGGVAVLVEGEADALAASLLCLHDPALAEVAQAPDGTPADVKAVLAAGGTAGMVALALAEAPRRSALRLLPDPDPAGRTAARLAALAVRRAGFPLPDCQPWPGGDPADVLAEAIREREAIRDPDGADPEAALAGAWTDFNRPRNGGAPDAI